MTDKKNNLLLISLYRILALFIIGFSLHILAASLTQAANFSPGPIYWGAYMNGAHYGTKADGSSYKDAPYGLDTWDLFESHAGKKVSLVQIGYPFYANSSTTSFALFPASDLDKITARGAIPFVGWGSWRLGMADSVCQPEFKLTNVTRGDFDAGIRAFAKGAKAWGKPFFLNLNHEQNLNGQFPWQYGGTEGKVICQDATKQYSNTAQDFVDSWRHVYDIFTQEGVGNVTWAWVPNIYYISGSHAQPFMPSYPGDSYVDWVGFNAFNHQNGSTGKWDSFSSLVDDSYKVLTGQRPDISPGAPSKPIMLMATASNEKTGDNGLAKAAWIRDVLQTQLTTNYPNIKGFMWFNWNSRTENIVIESSSNAQVAFAQSIAAPYFATNTLGVLSGKVQPLVAPAATPDPNLSIILPEADTYIASASANTAFGAASSLYSDGTTLGIKKAFLRFNLSGLVGKTVSSVTLRFKTSSIGGTVGIHAIKFVSDDAWAEQFMTANNTVIPSAISTTPIGTVTSCAANSVCEFSLDLAKVQSQLTSTDGKLSIMIDTLSSDDLNFFSRESSGNEPSLTVALTPTPPALSKTGDLDGNNKVDIFDYNILLTNFGKLGIGVQGDIDNSDKVDIFDYNQLLTNFGK